jgi:hypothetical protein
MKGIWNFDGKGTVGGGWGMGIDPAHPPFNDHSTDTTESVSEAFRNAFDYIGKSMARMSAEMMTEVQPKEAQPEEQNTVPEWLNNLFAPQNIHKG